MEQQIQNSYDGPVAPIMSTKEWVITILLTAIPIVGIILLFVWAFGDGENPNKKNWAKANLLTVVIVFATVIGLSMAFGLLAVLFS